MVSIDAPEEGLVHTEPNTSLFFGDRDRGKGTLFISEYNVIWRGTNPDHTLTLDYPSITLHAISRDTGSFPHECLYVLLESAEVVSEEERDPEADVTEVRFVPENGDNIKSMYDAVTECQELHPDPEDVDSEEEQDITRFLQQGQFYTAENLPEEIELSEEGRAVLQRLQISAQGDVEAAMQVNGVSNNGDTCNGVESNGVASIGVTSNGDQFDDADDDMGES